MLAAGGGGGFVRAVLSPGTSLRQALVKNALSGMVRKIRSTG